MVYYIRLEEFGREEVNGVTVTDETFKRFRDTYFNEGIYNSIYSYNDSITVCYNGVVFGFSRTITADKAFGFIWLSAPEANPQKYRREPILYIGDTVPSKGADEYPGPWKIIPSQGDKMAGNKEMRSGSDLYNKSITHWFFTHITDIHGRILKRMPPMSKPSCKAIIKYIETLSDSDIDNLIHNTKLSTNITHNNIHIFNPDRYDRMCKRVKKATTLSLSFSGPYFTIKLTTPFTIPPAGFHFAIESLEPSL